MKMKNVDLNYDIHIRKLSKNIQTWQYAVLSQ